MSRFFQSLCNKYCAMAFKNVFFFTKNQFSDRLFQTCDLAMESYSFTTNEMTLKWKNNAGRPIDIGADLDQPQFIMTQMKDTNNAFVFSAGSFDNVQVILYFVYKFI